MSMSWAARTLRSAVELAAVGGMVLTGAAATADEWRPERAVETIVGVPPGGPLGTTASFVDTWMKAHGYTPPDSIMVPMPGGGHAVALNYMHNLEGDPHHLSVVVSLLISNNLLGRSELRYTDFTPIAILYDEPMAFAVKADSPITDAADLARRLTEDPGSVSFSVSSGLGTANHLSVVKLAQAVGADVSRIRAVSFESGAEGMAAVVGGHIDVVVTPPKNTLQFVESGDLRFIGIVSEERAPGSLGDLPTFREQGVDVAVSAWRGMVAPPGLTDEQIAFWDDAFAAMVASDEYAAFVEEGSFTPRYLDSEQAMAFFAERDLEFQDYLLAAGAVEAGTAN